MGKTSKSQRSGDGKNSVSVASSDAEALDRLERLQAEHKAPVPRKKITLVHRNEQLGFIDRVGRKENGSEFDALTAFALEILCGNAIHPLLQELVNLIVTKAVFAGALPNQKKGRPKSEDLYASELSAAKAYFDKVDSGIGYADAVDAVSREYNKSERHVMRLVSKHKNAIGDTPEKRRQRRDYEKVLSHMYSLGSSSTLNFYAELLQRQPNPDDIANGQHLDKQIAEIAARAKSLPINE